MHRFLWLAALLLPAPQAVDWRPVPVPGPRSDVDPVAWYRCWVKGHDSFFAKHERTSSRSRSA